MPTLTSLLSVALLPHTFSFLTPPHLSHLSSVRMLGLSLNRWVESLFHHGQDVCFPSIVALHTLSTCLSYPLYLLSAHLKLLGYPTYIFLSLISLSCKYSNPDQPLCWILMKLQKSRENLERQFFVSFSCLKFVIRATSLLTSPPLPPHLLLLYLFLGVCEF